MAIEPSSLPQLGYDYVINIHTRKRLYHICSTHQRVYMKWYMQLKQHHVGLSEAKQVLELVFFFYTLFFFFFFSIWDRVWQLIFDWFKGVATGGRQGAMPRPHFNFRTKQGSKVSVLKSEILLFAGAPKLCRPGNSRFYRIHYNFWIIYGSFSFFLTT